MSHCGWHVIAVSVTNIHYSNLLAPQIPPPQILMTQMYISIIIQDILL